MSCLILALVMRHIYRLSKQVQAGSDTVAAKRKVNTLVTASHIGVTLAFSVSQFIIIFNNNDNNAQEDRMFSAFTFFGGLADLFLSLMLWFILESEKAVTVFVDGDRVYSVIDVIRPRDSGINEDCIEEELREDISDEHVSTRSSVSRLMIEQFFNEEEGPDRDWQKYDNFSDVFGEDEDRAELSLLQLQ